MIENSANLGVARYGDADGLSLDAVCDLLANQRRQYALACLMDRTRAVAMTELAEDIAVRENERPLTEIPQETVRSISTSLYHCHLPRLVDGGVIEYDRDRKLVQASEVDDLVERVLSLGEAGGEGR